MTKFSYTLFLLLVFGCFLLPIDVSAQTAPNSFNYEEGGNFEIGGVTVSGNEYSDATSIAALSGLTVGKKIQIPGTDIPGAIKKLWKLRLFTDVQISQTKKIGDVIFLEIIVEEKPRLSRHSFVGVKKSFHEEMNKKVNRYLVKGSIVTESMKMNSINALKTYWIDKGFLDVTVDVSEMPDSVYLNSVRLQFDVNRNKRVKIQDIVFEGNNSVKSNKLVRMMKNTRRIKRFFTKSKLVDSELKTDIQTMVAFYNTKGYKDCTIEVDSLYRTGEKKRLMLKMKVNEGNQYYFRDIVWNGNSIYSSEQLSKQLGIEKGDVFNQELLDTRLSFSPDGRDVTSLYMDNGYLFFQINPIEKAIQNDSIDLEIRIFEGALAYIDKVIIKGNDRTHDHVVRRELRTKPGAVFSRSDIIRSQREIANLGYFNPETISINTPVNQQRGTVDIEYIVEEKPSDQLELSAGWGGAGRGVIGTLGVTFNNFSVRNLLKKETWSPLPQGDGQRLSIRGQTNGRFYQSYNASFTEPWLGGKKPTSFTLGLFHSAYTNGLDKETSSFAKLSFTGASVGVGTRLKWPDDFFVSSTTLSFQNITLNNWTGFAVDDGSRLNYGTYNNLSLNQTISRSSVNEPIFPRSGSKISLSAQVTLPYSAFNNKDYSVLGNEEKFQWLEYHKWNFRAEWYTTLIGKLVLKTGIKVGALGYYNEDIGRSPFERFELGGDGLSNQGGIEGKDIISMRGYEPTDLAANFNNGVSTGAAVFDKMTLELRYPISLNPSSTIYVLTFFEGGNAWKNFRDFNPLDLKRSAGVGLRVFLPMFGTLGFDYGYGFDKDLEPGTKWGEYAQFNIVLGFEPE